MATYAEQLQKIWKKYEEAENTTAATAREVARWAIKQGLWKPQPDSVERKCAEELAKAAREEYRTDESGKRYRARHVATFEKNGSQLSIWADIDKAPRKHMQIAFGQRRKQIVGDCHQLKTDIDHYNGIHPEHAPIQTIFDFTEDLREIEALEEYKHKRTLKA